MAGDLPFEEVLVIHGLDGTPPPEVDAGPSAPVGPPDDLPDAPVLQRYGDRVEILLGPSDGAPAALPDVPDDVLESLTLTERLGVEALLLRSTPEFARAKRHRPRDGEEWDQPGCAVELDPDVEAVLAAELDSDGDITAQVVRGSTSQYLKGSVAVGVVIVNGPTAATQFTAAERLKVVAEVQAGLGWLAGVNRWAGVSFTYDIRNVTIATQPNATATDNESRWRNPAMGQVGFAQNWSGVGAYVNWLRANRRTTWAFCAFFVKGYPLDHFGYASIGGPRIVMDYANDGWGPDNIDRVFAHETGHIFQAPDEYSSSGCDCGGSWGRFNEPNRNCESCATGGGVSCLMRANTWDMCGATKRHFGWGLTSLRTRQPSAVHVVSRGRDHLDVFASDANGWAVTAAWEPAMVTWWEGWWGLIGGRTAPGGHVTAVSRRANFLDVFTVGTDGYAYTCAWAPGQGWRGWWRIGSARFPQGAHISAVSRSTDKLDIFATDSAGRVLTAAWEPAHGWRGWWDLRGGRARAGAPVTVVSRNRDHLDVFVVGTDGYAYTAAWAPGQGWRGWWRLKNPRFPQGAYIGAVSRSTNKLDIFATDVNGNTLSAAWEPAFTDGWRGWWHIRGGRAQAGAPVTAVSRSSDKLDIFVIGTDRRIFTAAWQPSLGWRGWWSLNGGAAAHGAMVTAAVRRPDYLDVFVIGTDGRPYTAAWPGSGNWLGWWAMGD